MRLKENALKIIRFDCPEWVMTELPALRLCYHGCNHEGFENDLGDDHPVGSKWNDIWGTEWHKVHQGVMGLPRGTPSPRLKI